METFLLIPDHLGVAVTRHLDSQSHDKPASIWSKTNIPVDFTFYSDEGRIYHGNIDMCSIMDKNDVRHTFGGYDLVLEIHGHKMRHCNWIRFVRSSIDTTIINMAVTKEGNRSLCRAVRDIEIGEEIVVLWNASDDKSVVPESEVNEPHTDDDEDIEIDVCGISDDEDDGVGSGDSFSQSSQTANLTPTSSLHASSVRLRSRKRMRSIDDGEEMDSGIGDISNTVRVLGEVSSPETYEDFERHHSINKLSNDYNHHSTPITSNGNSLKRKRGKTLLKCEFCDKEFDRPSLLQRHERIHTGEKPHVCDVCSKAFSTTSSLNTHRRIHFGEKPHECSICGKRFTVSSNLYYHKMTHTKDKSHKCTLCTKSFPTPGDLRNHMHIHNGTYPYTCSVCQKGFSKQASLKVHMSSHTETESPFSNVSNGNSAPCPLSAHKKTPMVGTRALPTSNQTTSSLNQFVLGNCTSLNVLPHVRVPDLTNQYCQF